MKILRLPEELRSELKPPLGKLFRGRGQECIAPMQDLLRPAPKVIAVGDVTTFCLLSFSGRKPDICIVDNKTKRMPVPDHVQQGIGDLDSYEIVEVANPAATLSQELIDVIKDRLASDGRVKIVVDGEEDLATLPAIVYAPLGSTVVYGQPNEGSVAVVVTPERKEYAKSIMDKMIVED
ncbi:MAG TPA: GTP-dependent dephospho-CoA kinase family protein [Methanothrix sp.]|nr:GTP-dependent dephospho-CoA kinase family protein [Methanothrix sp.]HRW83716.1 GTP-dependent dephospho-CoA kinase family protein [Methanothrix sp.]